MTLAFAFTLPRRLASPLYRPRRDLAFSGGDGVRLEVAVTDTDGGAALDVTDAQAVLLLARARGGAVFRRDGSIIDGPTGRVDLVLDTTETMQFSGEYRWQVAVTLADGTHAACAGAMIVAPRLGEGGDGIGYISGGGPPPSQAGDYILLE